MKLKFVVLIFCLTLVNCNDSKQKNETSDELNSSDTPNNSNNKVIEINPNAKSTTDSPTIMNPDQNDLTDQNLIIGDWTFSDNYGNFNGNDKSSMIATGSKSFNNNGVYNYSADIVVNMYNEETSLTISLSYKYEETGTWDIQDGILSETVTDNRATPTNENASAFEKDNPNEEGIHQFLPLKNDVTHYDIKNISSTILDVVEKKGDYHETVFHKQ